MGAPQDDKERLLENLRTAFELHDFGVGVMRQNLRRQYPEARESEIDERLNDWLRERKGAEYGDAEGRPVSFPRK